MLKQDLKALYCTVVVEMPRRLSRSEDTVTMLKQDLKALNCTVVVEMPGGCISEDIIKPENMTSVGFDVVRPNRPYIRGHHNN